MNVLNSKLPRLLGMTALIGALTSSLAYAIYNVTIWIIIICIYIVNYGDIALRVNGVDYVGSSSGSGSYQVVSESPESDLNHRITLLPTDIRATSNIDGFGQVETSLDLTRTSPESTVEGLVPGQDFPARVRIRFFANATKDGVLYSSVQPVVFASDNVNSFNPFRNEAFTLESPVDFTGPDGAVAFTLTKLNSTFNQ